MTWHIYNQLFTVPINCLTSECNLTRKSNTTKRPPNHKTLDTETEHHSLNVKSQTKRFLLQWQQKRPYIQLRKFDGNGLETCRYTERMNREKQPMREEQQPKASPKRRDGQNATNLRKFNTTGLNSSVAWSFALECRAQWRGKSDENRWTRRICKLHREAWCLQSR